MQYLLFGEPKTSPTKAHSASTNPVGTTSASGPEMVCVPPSL